MSIDFNRPIKWSTSYAIGIPLIDSQHQRLVEMAEDLRKTISNGEQTTATTKVLKGLITYCGDHFECEQMLMQAVSFPTQRGHLSLHQKFTDQTLKWFNDFQDGMLEPRVVLEALMEWLLDHILTKDAQIAAHCKANDIDCHRFVAVSDVLPATDASSSTPSSSSCSITIPVEVGMLVSMVPIFGLWTFLAVFLGNNNGGSFLIPGLVLGANLVLHLIMIYYVHKSLRFRVQKLQLAHARQLADNMLAGEIAQRVAVMDLEDIDSVFRGESSPLVVALQDIVEHLRLYLPYIPEPILAIVQRHHRGATGRDSSRNTDEEGSDDLELVPRSSNGSRQSPPRPSGENGPRVARSIDGWNSYASSAYPVPRKQSTAIHNHPTPPHTHPPLPPFPPPIWIRSPSSPNNDRAMTDHPTMGSSAGLVSTSEDESPKNSMSGHALLYAPSPTSAGHHHHSPPHHPVPARSSEILTARGGGRITARSAATAVSGAPGSPTTAVGGSSGTGTAPGAIVTARSWKSGQSSIMTSTNDEEIEKRLKRKMSRLSMMSRNSKGKGPVLPPSSSMSFAARTKTLLTTWLLRKSVSVLVSDITGFNGMSLAMTPEELLRTHSQYVSVVETVSKATKGNVSYVIGDRVLISWNAASSVGNYAQQACKAALSLHEGLSAEPAMEGITWKIAVSSGSALVGTVGTKTNLSFAIIGPVASVASALCKLNAVLETSILICSTTWRNAKEFYIAKIVAQYDFLCSPLQGMLSHPADFDAPGQQQQQADEFTDEDDEENGTNSSPPTGCAGATVTGSVGAGIPPPVAVGSEALGITDVEKLQDILDEQISPSGCTPTVASSMFVKKARIATDVEDGSGPKGSPSRPELQESRSGAAADIPPDPSRDYMEKRRFLAHGSHHTFEGYLLSRSWVMANENRRMFALELMRPIATTHAQQDEWMYAIQSAENPFEKYNNAVTDLFYGNTEKGRAGIKAYLRLHPNDKIASDLLHMVEAADMQLSFPSFTWIFGWKHPKN